MVHINYKNDEQQDERLDPYSDTARNLYRQEQDAAPSQSYIDAGTDQAAAFANDPKNATTKNTDATKDREEAGGNSNSSNTAPWTDNVTGANQQKATGKGSFFKGKGPLGIIAGIVLGGGVGLSFFGTQGLLLVHIKELAVEHFDTQSISMSARTDRMIVSKITGNATEGSCQIVKVMCRFSRPSNKLLQNLNDAGITALDKNGKPIDIRKGPFPNTRPDSYRFTTEKGTTLNVKAKSFSSTLSDNTEFRAAFHKAFNPRFAAFSDSIYGKILARFGTSKSDPLKDATTTEEADNTLASESAGGNNTLQEEASGSTSNTEEEATLTDEITQEAEKEVKGRLSYSKTDSVLMAASAACMATDVPSLITSAVRAYQMAQLIKYATTFLVVGDAIKAGNATPTEVAALGGILTAAVSYNGVKKSAMDSYGMKYLLFGDTGTAGDVAGHSYTKYTPGGSIAGTIGKATVVRSTPGLQGICNEINTPQAAGAATAAEIGISCAFVVTCGWSDVVYKAGSAALGVAVGAAISASLPFVIKLLPLNSIFNYFLGDLTKNVTGVDAGNALASGTVNLMGQTANAGFNMPMTKQQAVAYSQLTNQVNLAYAQEDQATLSPFDASSSHTFLGSIYNHFLPYTSELSSASGTLAFVGNFFSQSFGAMFTNSFADSPSDVVDTYEHDYCQDQTVTRSGIATGPFCNILYGIPPQYLGEDTLSIAQRLIDEGQIDDTTGDPKSGSDMQKWLDMCTNGEAEGAAQCVISDKKHADYAIYSIDHRIQKDMDGEDPGAQGASSSSSNATDSSGGSTATTGSDIGTDDYAGQCSQYAYCTGQCVDFVLFRLVKHGVLPHKMALGNGRYVVGTLGKLGFTVNTTPAVHSVMSTSHTSQPALGHTAMVSQVNSDGSIVVEEYNYTHPLHYDTRTISAAEIKADDMTFAHTETKYQ